LAGWLVGWLWLAVAGCGWLAGWHASGLACGPIRVDSSRSYDWKNVAPTVLKQASKQAISISFQSLPLIVKLDQSSVANKTGTTDSKLASSNLCCRIEWFFPIRCRRGNCRTTMHRAHTERHVQTSMFLSVFNSII